MALTQKQIAERVGVSATAVSLTLANPDTRQVSPEKKARIVKLAAKLPSRNRRSGGAVGVCLDLDAPSIGNNWKERILAGVRQAADEWGRQVVVESRLAPLCELARGGGTAGLVLISNRTQLGKSALPERMPVVHVNVVPSDDGIQVDCVCCDQRQAVVLSVAYLAAAGHRRIAYWGAPASTVPGTHGYERLCGYQEGMRLQGVDQCSEWLFCCGSAGLQGEEENTPLDVLGQWAAQAAPPTAIICFNDGVAARIIQAAHQLRITVPDQLSVIGMDNSVAGECLAPPLTSVDMGFEDMGRSAVDILRLRREMNPDGPPRLTLCATELIERASVSPPTEI